MLSDLGGSQGQSTQSAVRTCVVGLSSEGVLVTYALGMTYGRLRFLCLIDCTCDLLAGLVIPTLISGRL